MTDISALEAYAGELSEASAQAKAASQKQNQYINGDENTSVITESGPVPTLARQAKLAAEKNTLFISTSYGVFGTKTLMDLDLGAKAGQTGQVTTDPNESLNGWYSKAGAPGTGTWVYLKDQPALESKTLSATPMNDLSDELVAVFGDEGGKVPLGFDDNGDVHIGAIEMETRNFNDLFPQIINAVIDDDGRVVDGYDPVSGKSYAYPLALDPVIKRVDDLERASPQIGFYDEAYPTATVVGRVVQVGGELHKEGMALPITGSVTLGVTATVAVPSTTGTLLYNDLTTLVDGRDSDLSYRRIKHAFNIIVTRVSDSALLVSGVDYSASAEGINSTLTGLISSAPSTPVLMTYSYLKERYDLIQLNTETLAVSVVAGIERNVDAHENFYRPKPTNGCIPLYYAFVVGDSVTLIDVSDWLDGYPGRLHAAKFSAIRAHAQRCLSRVTGKMARGQEIRLAGYGDSITAQGNGTFYEYTPNGIHRDRKEHYGLYPLDTRTAAGMYDNGDGEGAVHVRTGINWTIKNFLEQRFGITITYENWGIGGTKSFETDGNGLWPARFTPLLASKPDLCVVAFGMNELGNSATYANVRSIAEQLIAGGSDVIVMGVPRRNGRDAATETITQWRFTNRALRRAALDAGAAYAPLADVADDPYLGGIGIAPLSLSATNFVNHPGYRELDLYGKVVCSLF